MALSHNLHRYSVAYNLSEINYKSDMLITNAIRVRKLPNGLFSKLLINFTLFIIHYLYFVVNSFYEKISNFVITDLIILFRLIFDE